MSSDTTQFDLKACDLELSLQIAFSTAAGKKAWGYKSTSERLTFAWNINAMGRDRGFVPFVTPITWEQAVQIVKDWCSQVADYGQEPDCDGSVSKSWRIYCDYWGHIDHNPYTFAAVEPYWAEYGK